MIFELTTELLVRLLLFTLVFVITFNLIFKIFKNKAVAAIIGLSISVIALYYITYEQLAIITQSYGIMGITLLILMPFLIAFFFIYSSNIAEILRKMFWIFYGIVAIMLLQRNNPASSKQITSLTLLVGLIITLLMLFDNWIKNKFNANKALKR